MTVPRPGAVVHTAALKRDMGSARIARLRAGGHELDEGPCGLCGSVVVFSVAERLAGSILSCRRCCDDMLTANARQNQPVGIELPPGRGAGLLVSHDPGCPAPQGGECGGGCEPDVSLVLGEGGR